MNLLYKVKEVKEIYIQNFEDIYKINLFLDKNWIVIRIVPQGERLLFVLGRL